MTVNMFKNMDNAETIAAGATIFSEGDEPGGMMYIHPAGWGSGYFRAWRTH